MVKLTKYSRLVVPSHTFPLEDLAVEILIKEVKKKTGMVLNKTVKKKALSNFNTIMIVGQSSNIKEVINSVNIPEQSLYYPSKPEGFWIKCGKKDNKSYILIIGTDPHGVLYGIGKFLRLATFSQKVVEVSETEILENPAFKIRGHFLASHKQNNVTEFWDIEHYEEYIKELALFGVNTIGLYPVHFARWPGINPWGDKAWFISEERRREWEDRWQIQLQIPEIAHRYGMKYGIWIPPNDIFPAQVKDNMSLPGDPYVCPSIPEARELILFDREMVFKSLSNIDFLFVPSGDEGGCKKCGEHGKCAPWVKTYLKLVEDTYKILIKHHPKARIWISNQSLPYYQDQILYQYLDKERPEWIEYVAYGPGSDKVSAYLNPSRVEHDNKFLDYPEFGLLSRYLKEMRSQIPSKYEIVLYPDITHPVRAQYSIENIDPHIAFLCGREDAPTFRPLDLTNIHQETVRYGTGSIPYSEGNHDDFNKIFWSQLDWRPKADVDKIIQEYCKWWFGDEISKDAYNSILLIEKIYKKKLIESIADVDNLFSYVKKINTSFPLTRLENNWRWQSIVFSAYLLKFLQMKVLDEKELTPKINEFLLSSLNTAELPEMIRGVLSLYHRNDMIYNDIKEKLRQTAAKIEEVESMQFHSIDRLDSCITNLDWMIVELERTLNTDKPETMKQKVEQILKYEDPGPGGFYDDAGNPDRQPHLVREGNILSCVNIRNLSPDNRPSQNTHVLAPGSIGFKFRYTSLEPIAQYMVRVTYLADDWCPTCYQKLYANDHLLHDDFKLPLVKPQQFVFDIPKEAIKNGILELRFLGKQKYVVVSEVWLIRKEMAK
ncbi:MAG: hypothetical protein DRP50_02170 [Thermotoga sp.]|nr:MAG: hypothetical protein DRP50_02170 [Thermotoga sp.]